MIRFQSGFHRILILLLIKLIKLCHYTVNLYQTNIFCPDKYRDDSCFIRLLRGYHLLGSDRHKNFLHVWEIETKMESKCFTVGAYSLHICNWWQFDRFCSKKNNECTANWSRLALGHHLYTSCYGHLASDGSNYQHSFRAIQVFL